MSDLGNHRNNGPQQDQISDYRSALSLALGELNFDSAPGRIETVNRFFMKGIGPSSLFSLLIFTLFTVSQN